MGRAQQGPGPFGPVSREDGATRESADAGLTAGPDGSASSSLTEWNGITYHRSAIDFSAAATGRPDASSWYTVRREIGGTGWRRLRSTSTVGATG